MRRIGKTTSNRAPWPGALATSTARRGSSRSVHDREAETRAVTDALCREGWLEFVSDGHCPSFAGAICLLLRDTVVPGYEIALVGRPFPRGWDQAGGTKRVGPSGWDRIDRRIKPSQGGERFRRSIGEALDANLSRVVPRPRLAGFRHVTAGPRTQSVRSTHLPAQRRAYNLNLSGLRPPSDSHSIYGGNKMAEAFGKRVTNW
jgi:hypothetical protein